MTHVRNYRHLLRAIGSAAWAIVPEKLEAFLDILDFRSGVTDAALAARIDAHIAAAEAARGSRGNAQASGSVGVISIVGTISSRMEVMNSLSGGMSPESIARQLDPLIADDNITAIVLDIDSPGGSVFGVQELAAKVYEARKRKRVIAVANHLMASAAYWIGSGADEVVASPSAEVGSIGVFGVHTDQSEFDAKIGVKHTLISAGKYKVEGSPHAPLSEEARDAMQAIVDEYYDAFVRGVAKHRGVKPAAVRGGYGEGRVLHSRAALEAGLIDRVATLDQVIAELSSGKSSKPNRAAAEAPSTPRAHAGGAPDVEPHPETNRPHAAKEHTVSDEKNGGPNGATPTAPSMDALLSLAKAHSKTIEDVQSWVSSGKSLDQVRADLLAEYSGKARPVSITGVKDREAERGFKSFGEQVMSIIQAGLPGGRRDPRLAHVNHLALSAGTPSGMNESVGSEGGFFIQPELLPGVIDPVYAEDPILSRVFRIPSAAKGVKYNVVDETSRANGSRWGGIQMYWVAEADTATAKKPKTRIMELEKKKIMGIGYLTEELMQDAPASESLLQRAFQAELAFMLGDGVFRGTGAGQMQGFLNSGALVSQAIEATQTIANTNTFIAMNVSKMLSRLPAHLWGSAIWLYNQELLPKLITSTVGSSSVPVFLGANGISGKPFDTILGRPAFASELCEQEGTPGDLLLVAPSEYHMLADGGAAQSTSVHVRFLYDEQALKITYRCDGASVWRQAVTPFKGALTRSPFVALATRA